MHIMVRIKCSVQFSCSVVSNSLQSHGLQHSRPPCPSPTPRAYSNTCPSSQWCHLTIASSVIPFSSCLQSFPASGSFTMSQFFASGGQSIGVSASASVLPMNIQNVYVVIFPMVIISMNYKQLFHVSVKSREKNTSKSAFFNLIVIIPSNPNKVLNKKQCVVIVFSTPMCSYVHKKEKKIWMNLY